MGEKVVFAFEGRGKKGGEGFHAPLGHGPRDAKGRPLHFLASLTALSLAAGLDSGAVFLAGAWWERWGGGKGR